VIVLCCDTLYCVLCRSLLHVMLVCCLSCVTVQFVCVSLQFIVWCGAFCCVLWWQFIVSFMHVATLWLRISDDYRASFPSYRNFVGILRGESLFEEESEFNIQVTGERNSAEHCSSPNYKLSSFPAIQLPNCSAYANQDSCICKRCIGLCLHIDMT
jgi:hypothetical protein